ncbi:MAG: hypothetical protein AAFP28_09320 [Pseudomonadota bacterium]
MRKEMPNVVDRYAVLFVIGAVIAVNFLPWFLEPFGMLLTEPLEAAQLIFGRALLAAIIVGIFVAIRRYGWISTALFFLNPTLAFGWVRARGQLADKLTEMSSRPARARASTPRAAKKPEHASSWQPWSKSESPEPKTDPVVQMGVASKPVLKKPAPLADPSPVRTKKARHVSDLGPKRGDRFADSPIHTCRRGLLG